MAKLRADQLLVDRGLAESRARAQALILAGLVYLGEKKIEMLNTNDIMKVTGYVHGGCSPLGMRKPLPTVVDEHAAEHDTIFVSAGRLGMSLEIGVDDLLRAANAKRRDGEFGSPPTFPGARTNRQAMNW